MFFCMKNVSSSLRFGVFLFLAAVCPPVSAEIIVTPFGILDTETDVRLSYNVETEDGVETKSRIFSAEKISNKEQLEAVLKKVGSDTAVLSPKTARPLKAVRKFSVYAKPDLRASAASFKTRVYQRIKAEIATETREYYKENIPNAVLTNRTFFKEGGGSMVVVDKRKRPLGTLIVSYKRTFSPPTEAEMSGEDFAMTSQIPAVWERISGTPYNGVFRLPSGENVRVRSVGKFYRVFAFTIDVEVTYTFYKLEKKKKRQAETAFAVPAAGGALRA